MSNPYEIRTEILKMAKDYMDRQYEMNVSFMHQVLDNARENGIATNMKEFVELMEKYTPKAYTVEELNRIASEMYGFVQKQ